VAAAKTGPWFVYLIETSKGSLYSGISRDPERRFLEHLRGAGARFFRSQKPVRIVHRERFGSKGRALRREREIKGFPVAAKRRLCGLRSARAADGHS
jgi:putative endonuclease